MDPDREPNLKAAFAELGRRQRDEAPPFGAMRERALRKANEPGGAERRKRAAARFAWAGAAGAVALALWWAAHSPQREDVRETTAREDVDKLIAVIEQRLGSDGAAAEFEYPTDLLLVGNQTPSVP